MFGINKNLKELSCNVNKLIETLYVYNNGRHAQLKPTGVKYWVEIKKDDNAEVVPYQGREYLFFVKTNAQNFLKHLKKTNPKSEFRLVTYTFEIAPDGWEKYFKS